MTMTLHVLQLCAVDFTVKHFLRPLINFLTKEGFDVTVACSEGDYFQELRGEGLRLVSIPIARSMNALSHIRSTMRLYRYLKKNQFDILHVHTPIASIIGRVAGWAAHVPIRIYTAHGFYFHDEMPGIQRAFYIGLERFGARFGNFILTQSEEDRQTAIREKITNPERVLTIGNGVDVTGRFNPDNISPQTTARCRAEFDIPPSAPVVGMIGRIVREKGYFEFVEAASHIIREFPETHFLCIGDALKSDYDASKIELQRRIAQLKLEERIHFTGLRNDIPDLLSLMTVYVLPSYREGMPRSVIEAMAMARPVVATDIRGCREEVVEGKTGHLVPPRDAIALARAVCAILADPANSENFGIAGRRRAVSEFSEEDVLSRQIRVYEQLIREKGLEARR
jgi:glycosyltransferase involved in cell wall biosynthesis